MTVAWGLALLALAVAYGARLLSWAAGFRREAVRTDALPHPDDDALPTITVIVPARDEEDTIGPCVDSVLAVDYPAGKLDLIVVDDDSADRTAKVVCQRMAHAPVPALAGDLDDDAPEVEGDERLRLVRIPENRRRARAHKKAAIEKAVTHARGEIILTTDADCVVPPGWARAMAAQFEGAEIAFVSGPVAYAHRPDDGVFMRLQALDFFGLMACGGGAIGDGQPHLANGANVGYRRETFEALDGFSGIDHVTSGDDELLMQKIAYTTPLDVRFCADPAALVRTWPVRTFRAFVHQRKRWASKSLNYPVGLRKMLAGVVAFYVGLVVTAIAAPFVPGLWLWLGAALAVKAGTELAVLLPAARRFGQTDLAPVYPLHLLVHAPQSLLAGLLGPLGGFEWKGRRLDQ